MLPCLAALPSRAPLLLKVFSSKREVDPGSPQMLLGYSRSTSSTCSCKEPCRLGSKSTKTSYYIAPKTINYGYSNWGPIPLYLGNGTLWHPEISSQNKTARSLAPHVTFNQELHQAYAKACTRGPTHHISIRILHSGCKSQRQGIPEIMFCRMLMFMCSFGPL